MKRVPIYLREARSACERQFSFLVTEFGYRKVRSRFQWGGFELRYRGPSVGVAVEWFPRDSLIVQVAPLVNGDFPSGSGPGNNPDAPIDRFDLGDIESLASAPMRPDDPFRLSRLPDDETAGLKAGSLREYGSGLLLGDLSLIPQLEQRIKDRLRRYQAEMENRMRGN
jgi:hypothetical protein